MNEYIMTALRTSEGLNLEIISNQFGEKSMSELEKNATRHLQNGSITREGKKIRLTKKGKLLADGIAADLFFERL
jgi:oxygen-independent coproporphyrinogen-3 oxidase